MAGKFDKRARRPGAKKKASPLSPRGLRPSPALVVFTAVMLPGLLALRGRSPHRPRLICAAARTYTLPRSSIVPNHPSDDGWVLDKDFKAMAMDAAGIDGFVPNIGVDGPRKLNRKTAEDWNG
ncbi:hypothetical protein GGG16DRAFT_110670 [Schizophyllum commune]